jgi:hypothetical protein
LLGCLAQARASNSLVNEAEEGLSEPGEFNSPSTSSHFLPPVQLTSLVCPALLACPPPPVFPALPTLPSSLGVSAQYVLPPSPNPAELVDFNDLSYRLPTGNPPPSLASSTSYLSDSDDASGPGVRVQLSDYDYVHIHTLCNIACWTYVRIAEALGLSTSIVWRAVNCSIDGPGRGRCFMLLGPLLVTLRRAYVLARLSLDNRRCLKL